MILTEAVFKHIRERITKEIAKAERSIDVVVAWFTDERLYEALRSKASAGCVVRIMIANDAINRECDIDHQAHPSPNFRVDLVGDGYDELIHHKFCVIDGITVISGSYNWTNKAPSNAENVVIITGNRDLATKYIKEFNQIHQRYHPTHPQPDAPPINVDAMLKRLNIIKHFISLQEKEDLQHQIQKLKVYDDIAEIQAIIKAVEEETYSDAVVHIENYLRHHQQMTVWVDESLEALKWELTHLEIELNAYQNEKTALEKLLIDFQHRYSMEVGDLVLTLLRLKKLHHRHDKQAYKTAEEDEQKYKQQMSEERKKTYHTLTTDEKKELKMLFRQGSHLCHPDKVNDAMKEEAEKTFAALKTAYDTNDIKTVRTILDDLQKGTMFKSKSETVTEHEKIKVYIKQIKYQIEDTLNDIVKIKESKTYKEVSVIDNWAVYFEALKSELKEKLKSLQEDFPQNE